MSSRGVPHMASTSGIPLHNGCVDGAALAQFLQQANISQPPPPPQLESQPHNALIANIGALLSNLSQGGYNTPQANAPVALTPINALVPPSLTMPAQPGSSNPEAAYLSALVQQLYQRPAAQPSVPVQAPAPSTTLDTLAGTLPDDETILVNTLSARKLKGRNVREALEALHGVNNHTAGSWKDYFLSDYDNLSKLIACDEEAPSQPPVVAKEERVAPRGRTATKSEKPASVSQAKPARQHSPSRGRSSTRADPVQRVRFTATPSRSPTPPPPASERTTGPRRKYSEAEDEYFFKCVKWQLKLDPWVSGNQLARVLLDKAPECGRTFDSWRAQLAMRWKDEVASLTMQARRKWEEQHPTQAQGEAGGSTASAVLSSASASASSSSGRRGRGARPPPSAGDEDADTDDDIENMSAKGQPSSNADYRVIARYIASRGDWDGVPSNVARWVPFARQYPHRSDKAWAQMYANHRADIDPLVPKYRELHAKRAEMGASTQTGSGRIAKIVLPPYHGGAKRSHAEAGAADDDDDCEEYSGRGKRSRNSY